MTQAGDRMVTANTVPMDDPVEMQRQYYRGHAEQYDVVHGSYEHALPIAFMLGAIDHLGVRSVLDVGSGTGRAVLAIKAARPEIRIVGLEPVAELRAVGHARGLTAAELVDGDAQGMSWADGEFDLVCEFGVLHHLPKPGRAVGEMLRVASKAIFISDSNNFGQGSWVARTMKQTLDALGLWPVADFIKTKGKGYTISDGDGLAYSYSVFNDYPRIRKACRSVHLMNTNDAGTNTYRTATHVTLLGVK